MRKFHAWLEARLAEDIQANQNPNQQQPNPKMQADMAKKAQLAMNKYKIDINQLAKDPKRRQQIQNQVIGDPNFGPDVAVNLFKNM
jgi:hypothetical protein